MNNDTLCANRRPSPGRRYSAFLGLTLLAVACKTDPAPKPTPAPSVPSAVTPGSTIPSASSSAVAAEPVRALSDAEVRKLVSSWLEAQNSVNFADYGKQYAERFTGIKRVGETKVQTFDHESWLEDRKTMFKPGLEVRADDVQVQLAGSTARVHFKQSFTTDHFHDEGPKELVVIATAQGPRISREEMLASKLALKAGSGTTAEVWHVESKRIYLGGALPEAALTGPLQRVASGYVYVVEQAVNPDKLQKTDQSWLDKTITTFTADGKTCTAKITGFKARADVVPHFGQRQYWEGTKIEGVPAEPLPPASEVTEQVWAMGQMTGVDLVGVLSNDCLGAVWAMRAPLATAVVAAQPAEHTLAEFLRQQLRGFPRALEIQKVYANSDPGRMKKDWMSEAQTAYFSFAPKDGVQLAIASATLGQGCGDISEQLTLVFELDVRSGAPRVIRRRPLELWEEPLHALSAADLDGDGQLELLSGPEGLVQAFSYWSPTANSYERHILHAVSYHDCPC